MSPQFKSRFTAIALIIASTCGTSAIFGVVPLLASWTSPQSDIRPASAQQIPISKNQASEGSVL
jgi:hypothetical protein